MDTCEQLNLVIVGHVDHGKSTVIGRLLADTGSLPEGKLEQVRAVCARASRPFEYAFLLDSLRDEQAQGITIETTRIFFKTARRRYMILDAPGHVEFLKNMVSGAAKADAALLVIDAHEGIRENSKRHAMLLSLLGVRQVAVLINKMDLVGFDEAVFDKLRTEYADFVGRLGIEPRQFIPVAALDGENLFQKSERMSWYKGPTVIETVESFETTRAAENLPLRLPIQAVYKFASDGDDRRIVAGTVESGVLKPGDRLVFYPSGKRTTVRSIEAFQGERPAQISDRAVAGQATGFCMDEQIYVRRGEIACKEGEAPIAIASRIATRIFWLGKEPMLVGKRYTMKLGTSCCQARLVGIERVVDTDSLSEQPSDKIGCRQVADCVFELDNELAVETASSHPTLGRFVLLDGYDLSGGGTIRSTLEDRRLKLNLVKPAVIWFTGLPGSGKSTLAVQLVEKLRARGHPVEHLDGDEVRKALNERGFTPEERNRHIRNMAFVASRLEAHGVIVVASFVSPYRESREFARGLCSRFFEIHLSTPVEECERRDPKGLYGKARRGEITRLTGFDDPYEAPAAPELTLDTSVLTVEQCLARIVAFGELEHV